MNNKKQSKQPLFAEVELTGDEFKQSPSNHFQRSRFLKLVYPNDVTLILSGDISAGQLEQYNPVNYSNIIQFINETTKDYSKYNFKAFTRSIF